MAFLFCSISKLCHFCPQVRPSAPLKLRSKHKKHLLSAYDERKLFFVKSQWISKFWFSIDYMIQFSCIMWVFFLRNFYFESEFFPSSSEHILEGYKLKYQGVLWPMFHSSRPTVGERTEWVKINIPLIHWRNFCCIQTPRNMSKTLFFLIFMWLEATQLSYHKKVRDIAKGQTT